MTGYRSYYEPFEAEDIFGAQDAADRKAKLERARAAQKESDALLKAADEVDRKRMLQLTADASKSQLLREYETAGVEPPTVDDDGHPRCSLSMLLHMGWSIGDMAGERVLIRPVGR